MNWNRRMVSAALLLRRRALHPEQAQGAAVMTVWCVQHREVWCITARQARPPKESDLSVRTKCGWFVVFPWGLALRRPDCKLCKTVEKRSKEEALANRIRGVTA